MSTWGSFIARRWIAMKERLTRRLRYAKRDMSIETLHRKVDLMWRDVEFIRTHTSSYVGDRTSLTHLVDETPIFVNADDYGGPTNLINGGRYEDQNLAVLLSYVRPDTIFLDIGANLGFFSLRIGQHLHMKGRVHAFEPHPLLARLLTQSVYLNGIKDTVTVHNYGLSDANQNIEFGYPVGHLGGGSISPGTTDTRPRISSEVKRLDDVFPDPFACDLVKIDVEGHELSVMRGMERIIRNSPKIKMMFEKLGVNAGNEGDLHAYLTGMNLSLYSIEADSSLKKLDASKLPFFSGYVLATREEHVGDLSRSRLSIFPGQILAPNAQQTPDLGHDTITASADAPHILFHGPYWFLPKGIWRLTLVGKNPEGLKITVAARFGIPVTEFALAPGQTEATFVVETDLKQFELIGRPLFRKSEVALSRIDLHRIA
jgi:FkbM family methyltransferase